MSDPVTAQAFREAVDEALARIAKLDEWLLDREVVLTERDNAIAQIATLTAEYGAVLLKLDTCRGEAAKERHALNAQLDLYMAENEALHAQLDVCRARNIALEYHPINTTTTTNLNDASAMDVLREQITTLTAERDKHANTITTTLREAIAEYNRDCERLEKRAEKAEAELAEVRATLARVRDYVGAVADGDTCVACHTVARIIEAILNPPATGDTP